MACVALACVFTAPTPAQQTNPVDRKVDNPITDTPNVNPLQQDQPVRPTSPGKPPLIQPGDKLTVDCNRETVTNPKRAEFQFAKATSTHVSEPTGYRPTK